MTPLITLTTDFGSGSSYVAQLHGMIYSRLPNARIVDVAHDLPPFDIAAAELLLRSTAFAFPLGTTHVVVIDPGVGSDRRAIAVAAGGMTFVGPDNGVFGGIIARVPAQVVKLDRPEFFAPTLSSTFHGRDIFAPVAAELAAGLPLGEVGTPVADPAPSTLPGPKLATGVCTGETLGADRFGNVTTNLAARVLQAHLGPPPWRVMVNGVELPWVRTYEGAPEGLVALVGSDGYLEIALRQGSAASRLGRAVGIEVVCIPPSGDRVTETDET